MNHKEHVEILKAAEEAGLVRFEGGETEAYGGKASADDHTKSFWTFASPEKLVTFMQAMQAITT